MIGLGQEGGRRQAKTGAPGVGFLSFTNVASWQCGLAVWRTVWDDGSPWGGFRFCEMRPLAAQAAALCGMRVFDELMGVRASRLRTDERVQVRPD